MNKKLSNLICSLVVTLTVLTTTLTLVYCKKYQDDDSNASLSNAVYVNLDVNPEIELVVDKNNRVISVYGVNEDGKVLLFGEDGIVGKKIDSAVEKITDLAVEYGFLTEENKVVTATVSSAVKDKIVTVQNIIKEQIDKVSEKCGLDITTDTDGSFSVTRKFDEFKSKYPDNRLIQALTIDEFRLALSASETGNVSLEVAVEYDKDKLITLINDSHRKAKEVATDAYNKAKAEATLVYDKVVNSLLDGVYAGFYAEKIASYPRNFWYGYVYQSYKTIARGFSALSEVMSFSEKVDEYPLNQTQIAEVISALGLDESKIDELKDSNGNVTVSSIESYVDIRLKNMSDSQQIASLKQEINAVLDRLDSEIFDKVEEKLKEYEPTVEQIVDSAKNAVGALSIFTVLIPEDVKEEINKFILDIYSITIAVTQDIENGVMNSAKLREYADTAEAKASEMLEKIESSLSKEDKADIKSRIEKIEKGLSSAKTEMENSIERAEKEIKDKIEGLKNDRKVA